MDGHDLFEILMTYGWAIILIVIAIIALYGINNDFNLPEQEVITEPNSLCEEVCSNFGENVTYYDYGHHANGDLYCRCKENYCVLIDGHKFCKSTDPFNVRMIK